MWRRGANFEGDTANFIETEQLLENEGLKFSFLQVLLYINDNEHEHQVFPFYCFSIHLIMFSASILSMFLRILTAFKHADGLRML